MSDGGKDSQVTYLRKHKIAGLVDEIIGVLLKETPENPKEYLKSTMFQDSSPAKSPSRSPQGERLEAEAPSRRRVSIADNNPETPNHKSSFDHAKLPRKSSLTPEDTKRHKTTQGEAAPLTPPPKPKPKVNNTEFYREFVGEGPGKHSTLPCAHLAALALASTYLLRSNKLSALGTLLQKHNENRPTERLPALSHLAEAQRRHSEGVVDTSEEVVVRAEDIIKTLKLPLHYLGNNAMTLSELYDISRAFARDDDRLVNAGIAPSVIHFDSVTTDSTATSTSDSLVDDHGAASENAFSLSEFRERISLVTKSKQFVLIVNYDPLLTPTVSTGDLSMSLTANPEAAEDGSCPEIVTPTAATVNEGVRRQKHRGCFALVSGYNAVLHRVELVVPYFSNSGDVRCTKQIVDVKNLYDSMCTRDTFNFRKRGVLQLALPACEVLPCNQPGSSVFSRRLLSGTGKHGTRLVNVHPMMSTHLIAVAFGIHVVSGQDDEGRGQVGLDIGSIVRTLSLPMSVICQQNMSLFAVVRYAQQYISTVNLPITASAIPLVADGPYEAATNVSVMEVEEFLAQSIKTVDANKPSHIVLCNFDVNIAHGTSGLERGAQSSHWAIVVGCDIESHTITLADVMPKKFSKYWEVSTMMLHNAMVGKGMVLLANSTTTTVTPSIQSVIKSVRMNPPISVEFLHKTDSSFEFPPIALPIAVIARALSTLEGTNVPVSRVATGAVFDINFTLLNVLSVTDVQNIAQHFIANELANKYAVDVHMADVRPPPSWGESAQALAAFLQQLLSQEQCVTIVEIDPETFGINSDSFGGNFAVLHSVDTSEMTIVVSDMNPNSFYRTFRTSLLSLLAIFKHPTPLSGRPRGILTFSKRRPEGDSVIGTSFDIATVKTNQPFKQPFVPVLQAAAFVASALGNMKSAENIFHALGGSMDITQLQDANLSTALVVLESIGFCVNSVCTPAVRANSSTFSATLVEALKIQNSCVLCLFDAAHFIASPKPWPQFALVSSAEASAPHRVFLTNVNTTSLGHTTNHSVHALFDALHPTDDSPSYGCIAVSLST